MLGIVPVLAVAAGAPLLWRWPRRGAVAAAAFVRLLGRKATIPAITQKYCRMTPRCNDRDYLEARLGALLLKAGPLPATAQEAEARLLHMALADYAQGEVMAVEGWVLPESVVMTNAYARLNPA